MADCEVNLSPRVKVITCVRITSELPALLCLRGQFRLHTLFLQKGIALQGYFCYVLVSFWVLVLSCLGDIENTVSNKVFPGTL